MLSIDFIVVTTIRRTDGSDLLPANRPHVTMKTNLQRTTFQFWCRMQVMESQGAADFTLHTVLKRMSLDEEQEEIMTEWVELYDSAIRDMYSLLPPKKTYDIRKRIEQKEDELCRRGIDVQLRKKALSNEIKSLKLPSHWNKLLLRP